MRCLVYVVVLLSCVLPAQAADEPKPNSLTPSEIADGWILLFDGETTFGWKTEGDVKLADGVLTLGGGKRGRILSTTQFGEAFDVQFDCHAEGKEEPQFLVGLANGTERGEGLPQPKVGQKGWHSVAIEKGYDPRVREHTIRQRCDNTDTGKGSMGNLDSSAARVGFEVPAGTVLALRSVKLKPRRLKPIFNGKDLSDWKEFPGRKSKFTVTPEGWLNIKNGPGDLQTEGQWADFILQIDCLSNGNHLNSGVFFRCRPNEYQNGYEAQIQNGFLSGVTGEYTVEEYDPETHKLTGKKKVKSAAIDYGTGAIYRRVPARSQAAKDHEWFTMTVVADGKHLATWVNGIQQVDWIDNRPPSDNARNGCRLQKGPISLQGHDPTTDLSFRNIRIAELPAGSKK